MKPLDGLTVVVTRAKTQASVLTDKLVALGAHTVGVATIEIVAPADGGASLNAALVSCSYDQLVVGSPNGAKALAAAVAGLIDTGELDATALPPVACVGPSTAAKLADSPLIVNVVPGRAVAEGLLDAMSTPQPGSDRLLLVQAEVARDALEVGLTGNGWRVDRVVAYRTIDAQVTSADQALARSGDKGNKANVGIIARQPEYLPYIYAALNEQAVAERFAHFLPEGATQQSLSYVERYLMPGTHAINFLIHDVLGGGGMASIRNDAQGKGFGQLMLDASIPVSAAIAAEVNA